MSKGLEAFRQLLDCPTEIALIRKSGKPSGMIIRAKLHNNGEYQEQLLAIEKELKALEIIKSKSGNVFRLKFMLKQYGPFCVFYNAFVDTDNDDKCLTQEEYDLLKEVLL